MHEIGKMEDFLFKPEAKTIMEVFNGANLYKIPVFQRPYSWKEDQVTELFDDINDAFRESYSYYFLGSIILTNTNDTELEVIDGQQRLTTLTILFCVLRDFYFPDKKEILARITNLESDKPRLRFHTHSNEQSYFLTRIQQDGAIKRSLESVDHNRNLKKDNSLNAASILRNSIEEEFSPDFAKLEKFIDYLLNKVRLITITCSNKEGAVRLFRILNDRGLDLSTADLVKSYLYDKAGTEEDRNVVIDDWKEIETSISRSPWETDMDEMLTCFSYYLLESYQREAIYGRLETKFDTLIKEGKSAVILSSIIKSFASNFLHVYGDHSKIILPMWYLPTRVFWLSILVTALESSYREYDRLCLETRNVFYRYWLAGYTSAKVKQLCFNIIKKIKNGAEVGAISSLIIAQEKKDRVQLRALESLNSDADEEAWVKPILLILEYESGDESRLEFIELNRNLQLEHILPIEWKKNTDWANVWSADDAADSIHKIGNLTLLAGKKNVAASNDSFSKKLEIYSGRGKDKKVTTFLITQAISRFGKWTKKEADTRQTEITGKITELLAIKTGETES